MQRWESNLPKSKSPTTYTTVEINRSSRRLITRATATYYRAGTGWAWLGQDDWHREGWAAVRHLKYCHWGGTTAISFPGVVSLTLLLTSELLHSLFIQHRDWPLFPAYLFSLSFFLTSSVSSDLPYMHLVHDLPPILKSFCDIVSRSWIYI